MTEKSKDKLKYKCDVLLVTVTKIETKALLDAARSLTKRDHKILQGQYKTYFDLGIIGDQRVYVVRSEMGSDTVGGSLPTVIKAISEVEPSGVIMVGIAFGVNPKKQKIGDILVAKQLQPYELQRVGTTKAGSPEITLRGDKPHCSEKWLDRFRTTDLSWEKAKVSFGLVLSGQKLIDNLDYRDQLITLSEEAIGGEMEGGGLYVACQQSKVDWILVKAICDWADGKKGNGKTRKQQLAAQNAAEFVLGTLSPELPGKPQVDPSVTDDNHDLKPQSKVATNKISIARLPVTGTELFGRDAELQLLDDAWTNPQTNIITFIAWGGVGKTTLVNHWLKRRMALDNFGDAERIYAWSFYSQGTSERAASADLFIDQALRWFGDPDPMSGSPWEKGERLANLIRQTRTLLILDGLEPLQHPPGNQEGRLKDAALKVLLVELAAQQPGLCVISTRERVGDLLEFENGTVLQKELEHLSPQAGVQLLRALQVKGDNEEVEQAVQEYAGHALALTLLGSYLTDVCEGDIGRGNEIESLADDIRQGRHAERVMRAYEKWLGEGVELSILRLLGLFDRPADVKSIQALRSAPVIEGLTEAFQGLKGLQYQQALANLRRVKLLGLTSANAPKTLDAHPLIREHFKRQLKQERPETWREANNRLYEHLKKTTKEFPDTVEEMSPLYAAVTHGCAAGRYQEVLDEVYVGRIKRGPKHFNIKQHGAYGADLAALSNFFEIPWEQVTGGLTEAAKGFVLGDAGLDLRALGRLQEAEQPMIAGLESMIAEGSWFNAAIYAGNLSELYLTIGNLPQALEYGRQCVGLGDLSMNEVYPIFSRATWAGALHQAGMFVEAGTLFREAEEMQKQREPQFSFLYSLGGYRYCELLLDQGEIEEVKERATYTLEVAKQLPGFFYIALDNLSLGRAWLLELQQTGSGNPTQAAEFLQRAVEGLRRAGLMDYLPLGLLARAALHGFKDDYEKAEHDLAETLRIAKRGGMRLFLTDYHLESSRLHMAQGNQEKAHEHLTTAREMIEHLGYHRRDNEVKELADQIG